MIALEFKILTPKYLIRFFSSSSLSEDRNCFFCASRCIVKSIFYQVEIIIKNYEQLFVLELKHKFCNLKTEDLLNS